MLINKITVLSRFETVPFKVLLSVVALLLRLIIVNFCFKLVVLFVLSVVIVCFGVRLIFLIGFAVCFKVCFVIHCFHLRTHIVPERTEQITVKI